MKELDCTKTELDRWTADGRMPPDGERFFYLANAAKHGQWGRAWLSSTIEAAKTNLDRWREQDRIRKRYRRRGLRIVADGGAT